MKMFVFGLLLGLVSITAAQELRVGTTSAAIWAELTTKAGQLRCQKLLAEHTALETATGVPMPQTRKLKRIDCMKYRGAKDTL